MLNLFVIISSTFLIVCAASLSFWLVEKDLVPHAPSEPLFAKNINNATGILSIFVLAELIVSIIIAFVLRNIGLGHLFESSWLLKSGFIAFGGYILFYIDKKIRNQLYSFAHLIALSIIVVVIVGILLALCTNHFFYMLLVPISFISFLFMITIKELFDDEADSKAYDYSSMSLIMASIIIIAGIGGYILSKINGEPFSNDIIWRAIFAIIIGVWWLWVTMSFMANMQGKADKYSEMSDYTCLLYGTELILAFVILIVKNFIPSIKDVYENVDDINID